MIMRDSVRSQIVGLMFSLESINLSIAVRRIYLLIGDDCGGFQLVCLLWACAESRYSKIIP